MKKVNIDGTRSTPTINYNAETNTLFIKGESYPENSYEFYKPVFHWVQEYLQENDMLTLNVGLSYLNTSSTKSFMNLLDILEEAFNQGKQIEICWYYEEDNEHSFELAEEFKEFLELPFKIIPEEQ